jgi:hypothetical protein
VNQTTTVRFFATDTAGNAEASRSQVIRIDTAAPTTSILCGGAPCSTGWYSSTPVAVTLSATDNSAGSGVAAIYYTTNGSTPTTASTLYTQPLAISQTTTVRFIAVDVAGNTSAIRNHTIQVDAAKPTVAITTPVNNASFLQGTKVTVTATATDAGTLSGAASGVARVDFYVDGALISGDTSTPYSVSWNTNNVARTTHTLTAVATDRAGNSTTSAPITIRIL